MFKVFGVLVFVVALVVQSHAGEFGFEDKWEKIANVLSRPISEQPVRTRGLTCSFLTGTRAIKVVKKEQGKVFEETILVSEVPPPQSVNLKIEFDTNSYAIRPDSFKLLNELGKALISDQLRGRTFALKGHTDSDGSDAYNLQLSLNRTLAVQHYLVGNFRIAPNRLQLVGYGESMPLVPKGVIKSVRRTLL